MTTLLAENSIMVAIGKSLGLPETTRAFTIRFSCDGYASVECEYFLNREDGESIVKAFSNFKCSSVFTSKEGK